MKNIFKCIFFLFFATITLFAQLEHIALPGEKITSIVSLDGVDNVEILAGTESNGFYSHFVSHPDSEWHHGWFNNRSVSTLYIQKIEIGESALSRIFFGMGEGSTTDSTLIYTNDAPLQSAIVRRDSGIDKTQSNKIISFAGFHNSANEQIRPAFCLDQFSSIYRLENMGWKKIYSNLLASTFNVLFADDLTLWAGGTSGDLVALSLIIKSTDNGETWQEFFPLRGWGCFSIAAYPGDTTVVYAGLNDAVIKSSDEGYNWETILADSGVVFTSIVVNPQNQDNIFAGGKRSPDGNFVFYVTRNGGADWDYYAFRDCRCFVPGINTMTGLFINNKFNVFIGTDGGGIYKYVDNVVSVNNKSIFQPEQFVLFQNYPNPFNPVTSMQYAISSRQFVKLKVYNILGKEVATIINEEKDPGIYKITFNAVHLSSGVYFYKLTAGSYSETKKMILMK